MHRFLKALAFLPLLAAGCGTTVTSIPLREHSPPVAPRSARSVAVFASGAPEWPFVELAVLRVQQTHGLNNQGGEIMLDELRDRAGRMGCDGVVLNGFSEHQGGPPLTTWALLDPGRTYLDATCIVFKGRKTHAPSPADDQPSATNAPAPAQLIDFEDPDARTLR